MRISDWSSDVCSSDLNARAKKWLALSDARGIRKHGEFILSGRKTVPEALARYGGRFTAALARSESDLNRLALPPRSEEHTSELQSLMRTSYAVFCVNTKQLQPLYEILSAGLS